MPTLVALPGANPRARTAYKLLRQRRNGSLAPLFIHARSTVPLGCWLRAEDHPTRGYAHRPGWHAAPAPIAPHLSTRGRVWCKVRVRGWVKIRRPKAQGSAWYLAEEMKVIRRLPGVAA